MRFSSLFLLATALLAGCVASQPVEFGEKSDCFNRIQIVNGKLKPEYCKDSKPARFYRTDLFEIGLTSDIFKFDQGDRVTFDTNPTNEPRKLNDYRIEHHLLASGKNCSYETSGVHELSRNNLINAKGFWGYTSLWDDMKVGGFENTEALANVKCERDWPHDPNEKIYVLCSEKNEQTLIICITQQSDNPQLAEDIFKTFKWTK